MNSGPSSNCRSHPQAVLQTEPVHSSQSMHVDSIRTLCSVNMWTPSGHSVQSTCGLHQDTPFSQHVDSIRTLCSVNMWTPSGHSVQSTCGLHQDTLFSQHVDSIRTLCSVNMWQNDFEALDRDRILRENKSGSS